MKNVFKVLGIIALVAVIGFSMVSCSDDDDGGFNVKVVNNYTQPITKVVIDPSGTPGRIESSEEIAAGGTKTFSLDVGHNVGVGISIYLYAAGLKFSDETIGGMTSMEEDGLAKTGFDLEKGKMVTITLTADGKITK